MLGVVNVYPNYCERCYETTYNTILSPVTTKKWKNLTCNIRSDVEREGERERMNDQTKGKTNDKPMGYLVIVPSTSDTTSLSW